MTASDQRAHRDKQRPRLTYRGQGAPPSRNKAYAKGHQASAGHFSLDYGFLGRLPLICLALSICTTTR